MRYNELVSLRRELLESREESDVLEGRNSRKAETSI